MASWTSASRKGGNVGGGIIEEGDEQFEGTRERVQEVLVFGYR